MYLFWTNKTRAGIDKLRNHEAIIILRIIEMRFGECLKPNREYNKTKNKRRHNALPTN